MAEVTPGTTSKGTPARGQGLGLLSPAAEHERIAALEAGHHLSLLSLGYQAAIYLVLLHGPLGGALAHVDQLGAFTRFVQQAAVHQTVVDDHLRLLETGEALYGYQARVPRSRAYQVDLTCQYINSMWLAPSFGLWDSFASLRMTKGERANPLSSHGRGSG